MESDLVVQTFVLSKEQLRDSNCCRFCGIGGTVNGPFSVSFIPIFEPSEMANTLSEKLDLLINRYLPIKVYENELFYPRLICSTCFYALEETITFFDKITEGQKLLRKIIEKQNEPVVPTLSFSSDNPIIQSVPKKRGRPRKDPNQPKEKPVIIIKDDKEKPKRNIRAPDRYGKDYTKVSIKMEVDERETQPVQDMQADPFFNSMLPLPPKISELVKQKAQRHSDEDSLRMRPPMSTTSDLIGSLDTHSELTSVARGTSSILDLPRLNVIMDGDDEDLEEALTTQPSSYPNKSTTDIPETADVIHVPDTATDVVIIPTTNFGIEYQEIEIDDKNDDDFRLKKYNYKPKRGRGRPSKKKKSRKIINCPNCDKIFGHYSSLRYHQKSVHQISSVRYKCSECEKTFVHRTLLKNHMLAHSDRRDYKCQECSKTFKSGTSLNTHIKTIHEGFKFKCDQCEGSFSFKSSLTAHMRLHTGEKPFFCPYCDKRFTQKSNCDEHIRIHTNSRPYHCKICEKSYKTASQFRNHKLTHVEEKDFLCNICGKSFNTPHKLKHHVKRHNGDLPLECHVCKKQLVDNFSYTKHMRIHTGSKPYCCLICVKNFSDPSNYSKHMKRHQPFRFQPHTSNEDRANSSGIDGRVKQRSSPNKSKPEDEESNPLDFFVRAGKPSTESRGKRFFKNTEPLNENQIQIRDVFSQGILTGDTTDDLTEDNGLVRILNAEGLLETTSQDGQVIFVYPDDLPVFTITLNENQQAIEVRATDETTLQALGNLAGGPITFATVEGSELSTQYFNLETTDGNSLSVPSVRTGIDPRTSNDLSDNVSFGGALTIPDEADDQSQETGDHAEVDSSSVNVESTSHNLNDTE